MSTTDVPKPLQHLQPLKPLTLFLKHLSSGSTAQNPKSTPSSPHVFPRRFASPILALNTLDTVSATLPLLNSTFALTTHYLYALFPLRLEEAPPELIGQKSRLQNLHIASNISDKKPPVLGHFLHQFYTRTHFTIVELKTFSAASMKQWYNTTRFVHLLFPLAEHQEQWKLLIPKMK